MQGVLQRKSIHNEMIQQIHKNTSYLLGHARKRLQVLLNQRLHDGGV